MSSLFEIPSKDTFPHDGIFTLSESGRIKNSKGWRDLRKELRRNQIVFRVARGKKREMRRHFRYWLYVRDFMGVSHMISPNCGVTHKSIKWWVTKYNTFIDRNGSLREENLEAGRQVFKMILEEAPSEAILEAAEKINGVEELDVINTTTLKGLAESDVLNDIRRYEERFDKSKSIHMSRTYSVDASTLPAHLRSYAAFSSRKNLAINR